MKEACPERLKRFLEGCELWKMALYSFNSMDTREVSNAVKSYVCGLEDWKLLAFLTYGFPLEIEDEAFRELAKRRGESYAWSVALSKPEWFKVSKREVERLRRDLNFAMMWTYKVWKYGVSVYFLRKLAREVERLGYVWHELYEVILKRSLKYDRSGGW